MSSDDELIACTQELREGFDVLARELRRVRASILVLAIGQQFAPLALRKIAFEDLPEIDS